MIFLYNHRKKRKIKNKQSKKKITFRKENGHYVLTTTINDHHFNHPEPLEMKNAAKKMRSISVGIAGHSRSWKYKCPSIKQSLNDQCRGQFQSGLAHRLTIFGHHSNGQNADNNVEMYDKIKEKKTMTDKFLSKEMVKFPTKKDHEHFLSKQWKTFPNGKKSEKGT